MHEAELKKRIRRKLDIFTEDYIRHKETPVNLPLYGIEWRERLTYQEFLEKYNVKPLLSHQIPQCHICTRFETDDNPLFAYSYFEDENSYKFIYRCLKGHSHDHGMVFLDVQTGLEVYC
jgi:hypothetical protein